MASSSCTCWPLSSSSFRMRMMHACCSRCDVCLHHTLPELYQMHLEQWTFRHPQRSSRMPMFLATWEEGAAICS